LALRPEGFRSTAAHSDVAECRQPRKREARQIIFQNRFESKALTFSTERGAWSRTILRYIYYKLPAFIRRKVRSYVVPFEKKFYYETFD
jgi:hypothetical protein